MCPTNVWVLFPPKTLLEALKIKAEFILGFYLECGLSRFALCSSLTDRWPPFHPQNVLGWLETINPKFKL